MDSEFSDNNNNKAFAFSVIWSVGSLRYVKYGYGSELIII